MGVQLPSEPITRKERYLAKAAGQEVEIPAEPITREEAYLNAIAQGGGGGETGDYNNLSNQPQVNGNTLIGDKSASELGLASEDDLADKQDTLTAGDYIDITNNKISVNRSIIPENTTYNIKHVSRYNAVVTKYRNGVKQSENNYQYWGGTVWTIDDAFKLVCDRDTGGVGFAYQLLADTIDHTAGYYGFLFDLYETSVGVEVDLVFPDEDTSGQKLITKSELDAALAGKQGTLTFDDVPTANSNNPVKSGGVKSAIDAAVASAYHHAGTKTCVELVAGLLVAANEGNVYNMTDSGTTTADFIEGAGQPIKAGDNVGIAKISDGVYKFDLLSGFVDTSNFVQKSVTAGLLKNDGTVNDEIEGDVATLKSGLTNYQAQNDLNLEVPDRKNVLPNGVKSGSFAGVEWTLNDDGSITFNGTATQQIFNKMYFSTDLDLPAGEYIYNGGSSLITFQLANKAESQAYYSYADYSGYIEVTQAMVGDMIARLIINNGTVLNNVTIYPMIRPKSIESGVYAPYIPSVESRIEAVENLIIKTSETIQTNANGTGRLSITFDKARLVYAAAVTISATIAIPFLTGDHTWAVKVMEADDLSPVQDGVLIAYGYIANS